MAKKKKEFVLVPRSPKFFKEKNKNWGEYKYIGENGNKGTKCILFGSFYLPNIFGDRYVKNFPDFPRPYLRIAGFGYILI